MVTQGYTHFTGIGIQNADGTEVKVIGSDGKLASGVIGVGEVAHEMLATSSVWGENIKAQTIGTGALADSAVARRHIRTDALNGIIKTISVASADADAGTGGRIRIALPGGVPRAVHIVPVTHDIYVSRIVPPTTSGVTFYVKKANVSGRLIASAYIGIQYMVDYFLTT
jgi:hypothetical protein